MSGEGREGTVMLTRSLSSASDDQHIPDDKGGGEGVAASGSWKTSRTAESYPSSIRRRLRQPTSGRGSPPHPCRLPQVRIKLSSAAFQTTVILHTATEKMKGVRGRGPSQP